LLFQRRAAHPPAHALELINLAVQKQKYDEMQSGGQCSLLAQLIEAVFSFFWGYVALVLEFVCLASL
jgi:hypothetical protein